MVRTAPARTLTWASRPSSSARSHCACSSTSFLRTGICSVSNTAPPCPPAGPLPGWDRLTWGPPHCHADMTNGSGEVTLDEGLGGGRHEARRHVDLVDRLSGPAELFGLT